MSGAIQSLQNDNKSSDTNLTTSQHRKFSLRFWEIDHFFKCPVVGMCLTLSEQKQLLKKSGIPTKKKSPFEIHETLVASSESESRLSRRVDNLLNRKFGKETALLLGLENEAFKKHFKAAFEAGDCMGVTWAAAVNPDLYPELKREIFGDIHMTMHWSGEQRIELKQQLARQCKEIDDLRESFSIASQRRRALQKENEHLRQAQEKLRTTLAAVEREKARLEEALASADSRYRYAEIERENRMLKEKLDAGLVRDRDQQRLVARLEEKNLHLSSEIERQQESNRQIKKETQEILGEVFTLNRCDATCPSFDLCKKRILLVGGITRMESLYRELVENSGGVFEYHDGYMKKGVKKLENRLKRADVVVCPVSCNSHAACSIVKNLAKKHNKTVHMLANSSLNAVSQALWGGGDGGTIN
jgi:prefoldin subunit 5